MTQCRGCGIILQYLDKERPGYTPKPENDLCQRCYRLIHYDDLISDSNSLADPSEVLSCAAALPGLMIWVVDIMDIPAAFKLPLNRYFHDREILLTLTKRDLLPATLAPNKLRQAVRDQLKEAGLSVSDIAIIGNYAKDGLPELKEKLKRMANGQPLVLCGNANSGKSTLLKALTGKEATISRYPGTTLAVQSYSGNDFTVYDMPGILDKGSCLSYLSGSDLQDAIPVRLNRRVVFQASSCQSYALGGIVRLDLPAETQATAVFYTAEGLMVHRSKQSAAALLWEKHYGSLFRPVIGELTEMKTYSYDKKYNKLDICISGLGFITLSGGFRRFRITINRNIDVNIRKGMI